VINRELFGDDVREYLLEKWKSAYCEATGIGLEIDPILPNSLAGADRVDNLALSSQRCHQTKGGASALSICDFFQKKFIKHNNRVGAFSRD